MTSGSALPYIRVDEGEETDAGQPYAIVLPFMGKETRSDSIGFHFPPPCGEGPRVGVPRVRCLRLSPWNAAHPSPLWGGEVRMDASESALR